MLDLSEYSQTAKVMALSRYAGIGPRVFDMLITHYGTLDAILSAEDSSLREIEGMAEQLQSQLAAAESCLQKAEAEQEALARRDIHVVTRLDKTYPRLLNDLNDPPPFLYVRGELPDNDRKSVTIAGTSEATNEGIELTVKLATRFAEAGVQVVSSLRIGIDAAAHVGTKSVDRASFAVLDSGFDHIDSTEQVPLAIDALRAGGVITEYAPETEPGERNYVESNRLLAGISHAVVVTEIYHDSAQVMDLVLFCSQIGKLVFLMVDPDHGALSDKEALDRLTEYGAVPIVGLDKVDDIIKTLI